MPATSKAQRSLFQMALGVRKGSIKKTDASAKVLSIVNSNMTDQQLKDFADTPDSAIKESEDVIKNYIKTLCDENSIDISDINLDQLADGFNVELEHGSKGGDDTNVTGDDALTTIRIALAHLREIPDYYTRLDNLEANAGVKETVLVNGGMINGMGNTLLPQTIMGSVSMQGQQQPGSGDIPFILGADGKKKKYKFFVSYDEYEPDDMELKN